MDETKKAELDAKWKKIAVQAVTSDEFKRRLVEDPITVLGQHGLTVPEKTEVKILSGKDFKIQLPPSPSPELEKEASWWQWRLDMIREFGKEETSGPTAVAPETEEGI
ncbi:MAG: hypothetical protein HY580_04030 [Nitrospinae bacterium]|nr:hypothetical protein [Nitrospinota bacterium]